MSSLPTSDFSKLTIGNMPTTRGQSHNPPPQVDPDTEEESDSENEVEEEEESAKVPGPPSGLTYDIGQLSPTSQDRIKSTWESAEEGDFYVNRYISHNKNQPDEYYAYQIIKNTEKRFSVRIGSPTSQYSESTCSCSKEDCRHLVYLLDQIAGQTLSEQDRRSRLVLNKKGYPIGVPDPYTQIKTFGIERLAQGLGWRQSPEDVPVGRIEAVRDMMASLSPKLADDYRTDLFKNYAENASYLPALVPGDLEDTLARVLITDDFIFKRFREIINVDFRASDRFKKLGAKAAAAVKSMESYQPPKKGTRHEIHDVVWCGKILLKIEQSIGDAIKRGALPNLKKKTKEDAASVLVDILNLAVHHKDDMYAGSNWAGTPQRTNPSFQHSLYQFLIISRPTASFVVDKLEHIAHVAGLSADALDSTLQEIKSQPKPPKPAFINKLQTVVDKMKQVQGSKRSGSHLEPSSKRMKTRSPRRSPVIE